MEGTVQRLGTIRAGGITAAAGATLLLLVTHRPGPLVLGADDPTAGVVCAATWLAWALAGYLAAGVGAAALCHLGHLGRPAEAGQPARLGRLAAVMCRTTPACLRRLVEVAVGATTAVVVAGAGPLSAYADPPLPPSAVAGPGDSGPAAGSLDWPGLPVTVSRATATTPPRVTVVRPPAAGPAARARPTGSAPVALVSPPPRRHVSPAAGIVVRAGDSLWTLAARRLGPGASAAEIAVAWPRLYAANRAVIGTDPDLIHPGQRLVPPAADTRSP
jgi:hypothetical protein